MKSFFSALIVFSMSISFLYANEKVDTLTLTKIKKLVQKEEEIALAYKEYLLKKGEDPSEIQDLIDSDFLPKGYSIINPFGKKIILNDNQTIKKLDTSDFGLKAALNDYYYSDKNRLNTQSSISSEQNSGDIKILLDHKEKFIIDNKEIITNNKDEAKGKTDEGGYYIENGVLSWFDKDGKYQFSIAKDILANINIVNDELRITIPKGSKSKFYDLMHVGQNIYQPEREGLSNYLNLGKSIVKLEKEEEPTVILMKNSPRGSGVIINGDIYTWGNNSKNVVSIGTSNYTNESSTLVSGKGIINSVVRARAINYDKDNANKEKEKNHLNDEKLYSSPLRVKFINMYIDNTKSICGITQDKELYCGGEDILENNYIDFVGYKRDGSKVGMDYLYRSAFFERKEKKEEEEDKNIFIADILFVENTYIALARGAKDSEDVSNIYFWGKDNIGGWAGTGINTEVNILSPQKNGAYNFRDIFYDFRNNKLVAIGSGNIYTWGGLKNKETCIVGTQNLCEPSQLPLGEIVFDSIEQKINTIIAYGTDSTPSKIGEPKNEPEEKAYRISLNVDGTASKKLVEDDIKESSYFLDEDSSVLSFDYNSFGVIWVNSSNNLKGKFNEITDDLFNKTISQIEWEKIKVVSSNDGICGIDINKQMYCWGDLSNDTNDGFVVPIFGSNLQDENKDFIFLEKVGGSITKVTSGDWLKNSKYFIKYPTFIGGFNYDVIFK